MPPLVLDRTLPVTPFEDIRDAEAMFNQIETYLRGNVDPAYALAAEAFTTREIAAQAVVDNAFTAAGARRLALNRSGFQVRRQAYHASAVAVPASNTVLAVHTYTSEAAGDHLFYICKARATTNPAVNARIKIRVNGDVAFVDPAWTGGMPLGITQPATALTDEGFENNANDGSLIHGFAFGAIGQSAVLQLELSPVSPITLDEVAMYSWMTELG